MISFTLEIDPVPQGRPRFTRGRTYTPKESVLFRRVFRVLAKKHLPPKPIEGPVVLSVKFYVRKPKRPKAPEPIVKPDLDNYLKAVLDAMSPDGGWPGFWKDDAQVVSVLTTKDYGEPMIEVRLLNYPPATVNAI